MKQLFSIFIFGSILISCKKEKNTNPIRQLNLHDTVNINSDTLDTYPKVLWFTAKYKWINDQGGCSGVMDNCKLLYRTKDSILIDRCNSIKGSYPFRLDSNGCRTISNPSDGYQYLHFERINDSIYFEQKFRDCYGFQYISFSGIIKK